MKKRKEKMNIYIYIYIYDGNRTKITKMYNRKYKCKTKKYIKQIDAQKAKRKKLLDDIT